MSKGNIVFIDPKGIIKGFNIGIAYIASLLVKEGFKVDIIDLNNNTKDNLSLYANLIKNATFIGVSLKSSTYSPAIKLVKEAKQINPSVKIICGGAHPTIDGFSMMKDNPLIDFVIRGEGEYSFLSLVETKSKSSYKNIEGLIYRTKDGLVVNPKAAIILELDKLPYPDYNMFNQKIRIYPLVTSRGCPYNCTYCSVGAISGRRWRYRDAEDVIKELKHAKKKYGMKEFDVIDDNFTLRMDRAKEICRLIIKNKLNLKWHFPNGIRADRLDEELLSLMKKSGCVSINLGVESGVEKIFDSIQKGEKLHKIVTAVKLIKKSGITLNGFFILGLQDSTYKDDLESLKFSQKLGLDSAIWNIFVPYPETQMYRDVMAAKNITFLRDWKEGFHFGDNVKIVFETDKYSAEEKIKMYFLANLKSKNYGMLATEGSFIRRFFRLSGVILKHDFIRFPYHIINALFAFYKYRVKTNLENIF